uniref:Uncharacterized protein n=1 Tax=Arundo donax TaxID=35708 RepID=A0A0A9AQB7_ARUDO
MWQRWVHASGTAACSDGRLCGMACSGSASGTGGVQ